MGIKSSKKDVTWNYLGIFFSMGSNLIILPFMMRLLDSDFLGLWYVFLSIGGIVALFDFGFNPTFDRNVAYCWSGVDYLTKEGAIVTDLQTKKPNFVLLKKVLKLCRLIYLLISLIALVILAGGGTFYIFYVARDIYGYEVVVSWALYVLAVFLNLYYGYFATFLRGVGAVAEYNKISVAARIIQIAATIVLLYLGLGIIAASIAYLLYGCILRLLSKNVFYRYKGIGDELKRVKIEGDSNELKSLFSTIWHNTWKDGLVAVSNYGAGQASTLITSLFFSLELTGIYSISLQLVTAIATVSAALYTAFQPSMQSAYANDRKEDSKKLMAVSMIVFTSIFWLGVLALSTVGIPILKFIKPEHTYDRVVIITLSVYIFFFNRQSYYASFISNTNHIPYVIPYIVSSAVGLGLALLFVYYDLGIFGLILGQFIAQLAFNVWKWPHEVYKMLDSNWLDFIKTGFREILGKIRRRV